MKSSIKVEKYHGKKYRSIDFHALERQGFKFVAKDIFVNLEQDTAMFFAGEDGKKRVRFTVPLDGSKRKPGISMGYLKRVKAAAQWVEAQEQPEPVDEGEVTYWEEPEGTVVGELAGYRVEVEQCEDIGSPIGDWCMLGVFVGKYKNPGLYHEHWRWDYDEEFEGWAKEGKIEFMPIGAYEGFIYCTPETGRKELGRNWRKKARKTMEAEANVMRRYVEGEVYGFRVLDKEGTEVYACWGFIGESSRAAEDGMDEMRHLVASEINKRFNL